MGEEFLSGLCALYDSIVYGAIEDCLKVMAPHLVLTDCIQATKDSLALYQPEVALAYT